MNVGIQPYYWSVQSVRLGATEAKELCAIICRGHFLPASRFRVVHEVVNGVCYHRAVMKIYDREIPRFGFKALASHMVTLQRTTKEVEGWIEQQKKRRGG